MFLVEIMCANRFMSSFLDEQKTKESLEIESSIIKEMMDIVARRDSLITLLEEDRLRLSFEYNKSNITQNYRFHFACVLFLVVYLVFTVFIHAILLQLGFKT